MLVRIAVIDTRTSYRDRLVSSLEATYAERLEVVSFSDMEGFDAYLESGPSVDVMLVSSEMGSESLDGRRGATLVYLVEDGSIEQVFGHRAINRYQKIELIYRAILDACADRFDHVTSHRASIEGTRVITFFPASGGAGASTMAAACALGAARRGLATFYLNLELYGRSDLYFYGDGPGNLGDALFAIEAKKGNVAMRIQALTKRSPDGVCFLDPCDSALDVAEFTPEGLDQLVREIAASDAYDVIVCDLDYAHSRFAETAIELSTRTVFVSNGTQVSNGKLERLFAMLESQGVAGLAGGPSGVVLAYNNFDARTGKRLSIDVPVVGMLGHAAHESEQQLVALLSNSPVFDDVLSVE